MPLPCSRLLPSRLTHTRIVTTSGVEANELIGTNDVAGTTALKTPAVMSCRAPDACAAQSSLDVDRGHAVRGRWSAWSRGGAMLTTVVGDGMIEVTTEPSVVPLVPPPTSLHHAAAGLLDDSSVRPMITIFMAGASPRRALAPALWPLAARRSVRRRAFRRRVLILLVSSVPASPMVITTEARAAPAFLPPSSTVVLPPSWRAGSLASMTCGRSVMKLRGVAAAAYPISPRPGDGVAVETSRAARVVPPQCVGTKPWRHVVRRGTEARLVGSVDRRARIGDGGGTRQTGDTRRSASRLAVRAIAMDVTRMEPLGNARDDSAVPLLLLLLISITQHVLTAVPSAGHVVGM